MRGVMRASIAILVLSVSGCSDGPGAEPDAAAGVDAGPDTRDSRVPDGDVALRGSVRLAGQSSHDGVEVSLRSPAGDEVARAVTAADGSFALAGPPIDGASLRFTRSDGFEETVPGVRLSADAAGVVVDGRVEPLDGLEIARGVRALSSPSVWAYSAGERVLICDGCTPGVQQGRLYVAAPGRAAVEIGGGATCLYPRAARSGRRAYFLRRGADGDVTFRLVDLEASPPVTLVERSVLRYELPRDDQRILLATPAGGLEAVDLESGAVTVLQDGSGGVAGGASFSHRGGYVSLGIGDARAIMPAAGGPVRTLGRSAWWYPPEFSPDDTVLYLSGADRRLYAAATGSDTPAVPLLDGFRSAGAPGIGFFSPDGRTYYALARAVADPASPAPPDTEGPSTLFAIDVASGAATALASGIPSSRPHRQLGISPDGRWLFYVADVVGEAGTLHLRPANGGADITVATGVYSATIEYLGRYGVWFVGGDRIVFLTDPGSGRASLALARLSGGRTSAPEVVATGVAIDTVQQVSTTDPPRAGEFLVFTHRYDAAGAYTLATYDVGRDRTADLADQVTGRIGLGGAMVVRRAGGELRAVHYDAPDRPTVLDVTDQHGFFSVEAVRDRDRRILGYLHTLPGTDEAGRPLVLHTAAGRHVLSSTAGPVATSTGAVRYVDQASGDLRMAAIADLAPRTLAAGVRALGELTSDEALLSLTTGGVLTWHRLSDGRATAFLPQGVVTLWRRGDLALVTRVGARFGFQDGAYWLDLSRAR